MATSVEEGQLCEDRVVVHLLFLYIISVAIVAQAIVLQAASWGNHAAQESTVDGAVVLNSDTVTWAF